ncbi:DUF4097 family beta strand repeat protein [candidate division WOR-3 bacterium]|nr:DUF4097 family beta strand repeat protein [candidate division WOR-3 bacterium]
MNERLKILTLLEEGKINAQEAERLLEAISGSGSAEKGGRHKIWTSLEGLPRVISVALGDAFSETAEAASQEYPGKKVIVFKGISGDLEVRGTDRENILIEKDGFARIKEHGDSIAIKALSGNVKIAAPKKIDLVIAGVSGDISLANVNGAIDIESVSGDVTGKDLSGSLKGEIVSGDIDLDYETVDKLKIKSKNGNVILRLDEKIEAEVEIETEDGTATCDFTLIDRKKEGDKLCGIVNKAGAKIKIASAHGDVEIKKRQ